VPVPEGGRRIGHVVPVFILYMTPDNPMTSIQMGVFPSLKTACQVAEAHNASQLTWEHYDDSEGDIWFAETDDGIMYTIHSAVRAKLAFN
jgi:hypothetical protein